MYDLGVGKTRINGLHNFKAKAKDQTTYRNAYEGVY